MENFIEQLWSSYSKLESQSLVYPYSLGDVKPLKNELHKKIMELKIFLADYQWQGVDEEAKYLYVHAPAFCSSYIFLSRLESLMVSKDLMHPKAFASVLKYQKRVMEGFCTQVYPLVIHCRFLLKNNLVFNFQDGTDDWGYLFHADDMVFMPGDIFLGVQAIFLGKYAAHKKLLFLISDKKNLLEAPESKKVLANSQTGALNWTDTGMSLTEMAYALKYSGAVNKGNVDVKEIADALATAFHAPDVNIYRNKQDLYSRKSQSMFLDRLRKALILGLEESDGG